MTLNLNVFRKTVLEEIGGLNEDFICGYAEPILLHTKRSRNYRALMVGHARVMHYDKLTKSLGQSNMGDAYRSDTERCFREYPNHSRRGGLAYIDLSRPEYSTRISTRVLFRLVSMIPFSGLRRRAYSFVMWIEPVLTRFSTPLFRQRIFCRL